MRKQTLIQLVNVSNTTIGEGENAKNELKISVCKVRGTFFGALIPGSITCPH